MMNMMLTTMVVIIMMVITTLYAADGYRTLQRSDILLFLIAVLSPSS